MRDTSIGPSPEEGMWAFFESVFQPVLGIELRTRRNELRDPLPPVEEAALP